MKSAFDWEAMGSWAMAVELERPGRPLAAARVPPDDERPLSIVHISADDGSGGSGRSAYRVHTGLRQLGVRSRMLVGWRSSQESDIAPLRSRAWAVADRVCGRLADRLSLQYLCYPSSWSVPWKRWVREADLIQLYNTHGGYFSHLVLPFLSRQRPVVWRLSDMWALTGHCAYSFDCERWKTGCGRCPLLNDYPGLSVDTTALLWRVKRSVYVRSRLTIVAPSRWIAGLAKESPLLRDYPIHVIPNGLETEVFRPTSRAVAAERLGVELEAGARVVLFSAQWVSGRRKGAELLRAALQRVRSRVPPFTLLVVGHGAERWPHDGGAVIRRPFLRDAGQMAAAYACADVFVFPSLADNLPNAVLESLACGTPVVAFRVGGVPEAIDHLRTGYLAAPSDVEDLARGIQLLLEDDALRRRMGMEGRNVAERDYALEVQARRFLSLYETLSKAFIQRRWTVRTHG